LNIELNRRGGLPLGDQLVSQIELQILSGTFEKGRRMPSVRAMARLLKVHPRTVHGAYKKLQVAGNLDLERGSGAFISRGASAASEEKARPFDESFRLALRDALAAGYTGEEIRAAVRCWLDTPPPARVVVVDPARETAEILAEELRGLGTSVVTCTLGDARAHVGSGAVVLTLLFHAERVRRMSGRSVVVTAGIAVGLEHREALLAVPAGGLILAVSHSPRVVKYAQASLQSLRGHDVVVECHSLANSRRWRRVVSSADLVFADVVAVSDVARYAPNVRALRFLRPQTIEAIRHALTLPVPFPTRPAGAT
jgi:DNA-binding transcriptional regulator YhcF (GntR family)/CheY-like chemotaxis protein